LPWPLPDEGTVPWDQEDALSGKSDRDVIRELCIKLRGGVQAKYRGSSELCFKYGGPVSKSHVTPQSKVPTRQAPWFRQFDSGSMQAHLKAEEQRTLRTRALANRGAALSWPVECGITAQERRVESQKRSQLHETIPPPHQIRIPSLPIRAAGPRWRRRNGDSDKHVSAAPSGSPLASSQSLRSPVEMKMGDSQQMGRTYFSGSKIDAERADIDTPVCKQKIATLTAQKRVQGDRPNLPRVYQSCRACIEMHRN